MPSISRCPRCEQQVAIPPGVPAEVAVRCPLCNAQYPLADALASLPPMLVPVGLQSLGLAAADAWCLASAGADIRADRGADVAGVAPGEGTTEPIACSPQIVGAVQAAASSDHVWGDLLAAVVETEVLAIGPIVPEEQSVVVGQPATGPAVLEVPATALATTAAGCTVVDSAVLSEAAAAQQAVESTAVQPEPAESQPAGAQSDQPATAGEPAASEAAADGFPPIDAGGDGEAALPISIKARPIRSREVNPLVHIGGMVVFGIVGLGLGYYFSNLLFGPRMDFLHIPLPFVRHTYKHWGGGQAEPSNAEGPTNEPGPRAGANGGGSRKPAKAAPQRQSEGDLAPQTRQEQPLEAQHQPMPLQPGSRDGGAVEKPAKAEPPESIDQPKQPSQKTDQTSEDDPMQLPGDLPDIRSNQPIEEPELEPPPKPGAGQPASRAEL